MGSLPDLNGRCYAITGTTSGTGFWTAVAAVRKGATCVMLFNRKSSRADAAYEKVRSESSSVQEVISVECDLLSFASVRSAASEVHRIASSCGGLDGLLNNAGIFGAPDLRTTDGYDVQLQTNHLSHFLLTGLLVHTLEAAAASRGEARAVHVSSLVRGMVASTLEPAFFSPSDPGALGGDELAVCLNRYFLTKLDSSVFAMALHEKLAQWGSKVKSVCADPGGAATDIFSKGDQLSGAAAPGPLTTGFAPLTTQTAADGAYPLMLAAFSPTADSGDLFIPGTFLGPTSPTGQPVKCMTRGQPTPTCQEMRELIKNEEMTMSEDNRAVVWEQSKKATGLLFGDKM